MFEVTKNSDGKYEWELRMGANLLRPAAELCESEEECVESIKGFLAELGKHAFRNDFGGIEIKYELREEKQSGDPASAETQKNFGRRTRGNRG